MAGKRPTTIAEYIELAPEAGRPHLLRLYALLKRVAPRAEEAIKWGTPFFVEPRFVFAFSAHKAHLSFAPTTGTFARFRDELAGYSTTQGTLRVRYDEPLPEALIRKLARDSLREVTAREDDGFW